MKRIVVALGALAFVFGSGGTLSQISAHADEAKVEEAYKPPKDEPEINETQKQKQAARTMRKKNMKAQLRRMRKANHSSPTGRGGARCSSQNCR